MLHDGTMIPLDDHNGFGFVMKTGEKWQGTPRFDAFIKNADGTFTSITSLFTPASQENGYFVSSEKIGEASGFIHIVIYADNLEFNVGDGVFYDGNSLYTDGIFTLTYSVNYGEHDKKGDVNFMFGTALPANTSLRLFYRKEGVTIWSGGYGLTSAQSVIPVSSFASMGDNSALSDEYRNGASSEQFILVVTLPNNSNGFGITEAAAVTASVNAYEYTEIKTAFGNVAAQATDKPNRGRSRSRKAVYALSRGDTLGDQRRQLVYLLTHGRGGRKRGRSSSQRRLLYVESGKNCRRIYRRRAFDGSAKRSSALPTRFIIPLRKARLRLSAILRATPFRLSKPKTFNSLPNHSFCTLRNFNLFSRLKQNAKFFFARLQIIVRIGIIVAGKTHNRAAPAIYFYGERNGRKGKKTYFKSG